MFGFPNHYAVKCHQNHGLRRRSTSVYIDSVTVSVWGIVVKPIYCKMRIGSSHKSRRILVFLWHPESSRADSVQAGRSYSIDVHGTVPTYLADELLQPADLRIRTRLRSALTPSLPVRRTRLMTVGERAFPVAAARTCNDLQCHVTSASSLPVFRSRLKTHLFLRSFS